MSEPRLDLDRLLKLRLVVARFGEMDHACWWNTKGQLGRLGGLALSRGFPRTHLFAQSRAVFAVAAHRCAEVFDPPASATLWRLPEVLEDEVDARWEHWLDNPEPWHDVFKQLEANQGNDLLAALKGFGLVSDAQRDAVLRLAPSAEGRAVPLPAPFLADDATVTLLAAAFSLGKPRELAVPYAKLTMGASPPNAGLAA
jgi:hypothetical protein